MKKSLNSPELKAGKAGRPMSSNAVESITEVSRTNSASRVGKPVLMSIRDLSFSYQDRPLDTVLSHLDLDIFAGECLAILGASGSGKTTLLKLLCGLMRPDSGQIRYRGQQLAGPSNEIAMIFQNYGLFPWKTVRENVLLPLRLRRERPDREKTDRLLEYLGILPHAEKYPGELSGGQRQRTALGRAVMAEARLILMDEPFSALDAQTRIQLADEVKATLTGDDRAAILVTHDVAEAISMADRVVVFTARPARIRAEHWIDLPGGPMQRRREKRFQDYFDLIWKELNVHVQ